MEYSPAGSRYRSLHGPAHRVHDSSKARTCSSKCRPLGAPTWYNVPSSIKCMKWYLWPLELVQYAPSAPTMSLKSRSAWMRPGCDNFGRGCVSTQTSHNKSRAPCTTSIPAPLSWRYLQNVRGPGDQDCYANVSNRLESLWKDLETQGQTLEWSLVPILSHLENHAQHLFCCTILYSYLLACPWEHPVLLTAHWLLGTVSLQRRKNPCYLHCQKSSGTFWQDLYLGFVVV